MTYENPPYDPQYSPVADSDSCPAQGVDHALEMNQGNKQRWSPRAAAVLGSVKPDVGGTIQGVVDGINTYGLIPYDLWPDLTGDWTAEEYYQPVPASIIAQANKSFAVSIIPADLSKSALIVEVYVSPTMSHLMASTDGITAFDSYPPTLKPLSGFKILGEWGLTIKPKTMLLGYKVSDPTTGGDETVYIQVGNSMVPIADWQAFLNLGGSTGSVVSITQAQLNALPVVYADLFKTNS
jgi:hypothetical protein